MNPIEIICSYFKFCGFQFSEKSSDTSYLNCVMRRTKKSWTADGRRVVSYAICTKKLADNASQS